MSFHNKPKYHIPELIEALKAHRLPHDTPSQLADSFRIGWMAGRELVQADSGFDYKTAADFLSGKTVSDEAVRKFVAASRWAHDERAALSATLLAMHGVLTSREAEIAHLKKALLEAEAAPQQEAQEPALFVSAKQLAALTDPDAPDGEHGRYLPVRKTTKGLFTQALYTAPQPAPAPLSDAVDQLERELAIIGVVGAIDGHDVVRRESVLEIARRAALAAQGGK